MDPIDTTSWLMLAAALIIAALAVFGVMMYQRHQSRRLRERFGPEYAEAVSAHGRPKGEAELMRREKRVKRLHIVPLSASDAASFKNAWKALQGRFVDSPQGVLAEADRLVRDLMHRRGYPMDDFEHCAADLSVDHAAVVGHYRAARAIALRDERGEADTEDLRKAVVHYRALFEELCETEAPRQAQTARPAHS
ncbi:MAG TPA: hypothetical protein VGQ23_17090 [Burkholderiaceae bacterium]|jgi:hypothetical protein|nr:hypothetical protein [Burkholderiaceae bacterium]